MEKTIIDALSLKELSIEKNEPEKQLVYNLTIADCHEYFVNDILVHNCIAWLLSYWIITQGKNLDYYGISSRDILLENKLQTNANPREHYQAIEQQRVRTEIETLVNQMQNERDEFIMMRLENQLRSVANRLILGDNEVFSIDDLVRSIKERKRLSNISQNYGSYRY